MPDDLPLLHPASDRVAAATARHLARLHPTLRPIAVHFLEQALARGWPMQITESLRSDAYQRGLFERGVSKAKTAIASPHGRGAAFDVAFLVDGKLVGPRPGPGNDSYDRDRPWAGVGAIGEGLGLTWGGRFRPIEADGMGWDLGHFELPEWRHLPYPIAYTPGAA